MKKLSTFALTLLIFFVAGMLSCSAPESQEADTMEAAMDEPEAPAVDSAAVAAEITKIRETYMEMVRSGDYSPMQELAHPEFTSTGPFSAKFDEIRSYADGGPYPAGLELNIEPEALHVINDTWAWETGYTTGTYTPEGESESIQVADTYLMVLKNEGSGWKIYREVATAMPDSE